MIDFSRNYLCFGKVSLSLSLYLSRRAKKKEKQIKINIDRLLTKFPPSQYMLGSCFGLRLF
jgi:hypothetical protein